jgi:hypothetical protein
VRLQEDPEAGFALWTRIHDQFFADVSAGMTLPEANPVTMSKHSGFFASLPGARSMLFAQCLDYANLRVRLNRRFISSRNALSF